MCAVERLSEPSKAILNHIPTTNKLLPVTRESWRSDTVASLTGNRREKTSRRAAVFRVLWRRRHAGETFGGPSIVPKTDIVIVVLLIAISVFHREPQ